MKARIVVVKRVAAVAAVGAALHRVVCREGPAVCGNWRAVRCRCLEHASGSAGVRVLASAARMCAADIVCVSASARTRAKNTAVDQARMGPELERDTRNRRLGRFV